MDIPASQVGEAGSEACPKDGVTGGGRWHWPHSIRELVSVVNLCLQDDGDNHAVDCNSFAEDNTARENLSLPMYSYCISPLQMPPAKMRVKGVSSYDIITNLMRFLDVILGTRIAAPRRLLPVAKIPLHKNYFLNSTGHPVQNMCFKMGVGRR